MTSFRREMRMLASTPRSFEAFTDTTAAVQLHHRRASASIFTAAAARWVKYHL